MKYSSNCRWFLDALYMEGWGKSNEYSNRYSNMMSHNTWRNMQSRSCTTSNINKRNNLNDRVKLTTTTQNKCITNTFLNIVLNAVTQNQCVSHMTQDIGFNMNKQIICNIACNTNMLHSEDWLIDWVKCWQSRHKKQIFLHAFYQMAKLVLPFVSPRFAIFVKHIVASKVCVHNQQQQKNIYDAHICMYVRFKDIVNYWIRKKLE